MTSPTCIAGKIVGKINAFDRVCKVNQHTDSGEAWELLNEIRDHLTRQLSPAQIEQLAKERLEHYGELRGRELANGISPTDETFEEWIDAVEEITQ